MSFKVLVVEDNDDSRDLLHFLLTTKGFTVVTAVDGIEGFYIAKVEKPDLIITDLTMPNMDGVDLIKQVRAESEIAQTPIFIYTSAGKDAAEPALTAGATKIYYKPGGFEQMIGVITSMSYWVNSKDISN